MQAVKPWHLPPVRWAIFEKEPQFCGKPDSVLFGSYPTEEAAKFAYDKFGLGDNTYVRQMTQDEIHGK